ncbi:MAG: hypothetical protein RUMPE_01347 [Eubacteriales bacterium SKADARSKE-1]|nr:hypothetical protein [Eubacteriales bacterium SKADARSKE-1]
MVALEAKGRVVDAEAGLPTVTSSTLFNSSTEDKTASFSTAACADRFPVEPNANIAKEAKPPANTSDFGEIPPLTFIKSSRFNLLADSFSNSSKSFSVTFIFFDFTKGIISDFIKFFKSSSLDIFFDFRFNF